MSQLPINFVTQTHKEFLKENYEKSQKKQIFYLKSKYDNFMTLQDYFTRECAFRSFDVILFEKRIISNDKIALNLAGKGTSNKMSGQWNMAH